ncbi:MAG: hypothetical protein Q7S02_01460 [bacterium]|nr:hypothetical protein [bacterium]
MDRKTFRQKFALRLAVHPVTIFPFLGGATALLLGWAVAAPTVVFGGIVGVVVGIGALVTRAGVFGEDIARKLHEELRVEAHDASEAALDALREKLASDRDTRDEKLLDQLRELARVFKGDTGWAARVNSVSAGEITGGVEELVQTCVRKLNDAFTLLQTVRDLSTSPVRQTLVDQREQILTEVEESVRELSELLAGVYKLGTGSNNVSAETGRMRERLQRSLEVARRVEEQMDPHAAIRERARARTREQKVNQS